MTGKPRDTTVVPPPNETPPCTDSGRATQHSGCWAFADAGKELARLHLDYEQLERYPLQFLETPGVPHSYRVEDKMRLSKDKSAITMKPLDRAVPRLQPEKLR